MGRLTDNKTYDPNENSGEYEEYKVEKELTSIKKKEFYSDIVGCYIVDAITGAKYPWLVGSLDERRFFRVINTVPNLNLSRKDNCDIYQGRSSRKAFYENPYAYMQYRNVELKEEEIKSWYNKTNEIYPGQYIYQGTG